MSHHSLIALCIALFLTTAHADPPELFRIWGHRAAPHKYLAPPADNPAPANPPPASPSETQQGFFIFAHPQSPFAEATFDNRCSALAAADCPAQYGPLSFSIYALRPAEFSLRPTDLIAPTGQRISADNLDLRIVRRIQITSRGKSQAIPLLLETFDRHTIPSAHFDQFWLTYYIPPSTPPNTYEGKIRILVGGQEKASLPLRLTVHPFKLADIDVDQAIYYTNSTNPTDYPRILAQLIDQRCHGMTLAILTPPVTNAGDLSRENMAALLDIFQRSGLPRLQVSLWNRITSEWLNTPDRSIKMYGPWFRYYPFSDQLDRRYVDAVRMIRDESAKRGLKLELAVADEPGSHPWTTAAAQHYNDLIKRQLPDVTRELSVGGGWAMNRPEHELWRGRINVWTTNRWLPDKLDLVRRDDPRAIIRIYNMAGPGSSGGSPASPRAFYGFFLWKTRATGAAQWAYHHDSTPDENYTWPAADPSQSNIPTIRWEAVREGTKDYRYLLTLEAKLKSATTPAATEARAFLATLAPQIDLRTTDYDPITGARIPVKSPETYDQWRSRLAELISRL